MSWFPKIGADGRVIGGSGKLFLDGKDLSVPGWSASWLDAGRVLYNDGTKSVVRDLASGQVTENDKRPAPEIEANGAGKWVAWNLASGVYGNATPQVVGAGSPAVNGKGQVAYVYPRQEVTKTLFLDGRAIWTGPILELGLSNTLLVWRTAAATWSLRLDLAGAVATKEPPLRYSRFRPVPVDTPGGTPLILNHTETGHMLVRAGSSMGLYWETHSESFYPDARWTTNHELKLAWTNHKGELSTYILPEAAKLTDLSPAAPPPEPPPVAIPNHLDVVKAARQKYAAESGIKRAGLITNQVAWDLRSEGAGLLAKTSGDNYQGKSADTIIYKPGGETFDILGNGEGSADPQWTRTQPTGFGDVSKWVAASEPAGTSNPPPPVDPPVDPPPTSTTDQKLDEVLAILRRVFK